MESSLGGNGVFDAHDVLAALADHPELLERSHRRFSRSPPPAYSPGRAASEVTTLPDDSDGVEEEHEPSRADRIIQAGISYGNAMPSSQFEQQAFDLASRMARLEAGGRRPWESEITQMYGCVRQRWKDQGIWKDIWIDRPNETAQWKHEQPLLLWGLERKNNARPSPELNPEVESEQKSERDASRPYHQFLYQVSKERDWLLGDTGELYRYLPAWRGLDEHPIILNAKSDQERTRLLWQHRNCGMPLPPVKLQPVPKPAAEADRDINTQAYDNVKALWQRWKIWDNRWGVLPGLTWFYEESKGDYVRHLLADDPLFANDGQLPTDLQISPHWALFTQIGSTEQLGRTSKRLQQALRALKPDERTNIPRLERMVDADAVYEEELRLTAVHERAARDALQQEEQLEEQRARLLQAARDPAVPKRLRRQREEERRKAQKLEEIQQLQQRHEQELEQLRELQEQQLQRLQRVSRLRLLRQQQRALLTNMGVRHQKELDELQQVQQRQDVLLAPEMRKLDEEDQGKPDPAVHDTPEPRPAAPKRRGGPRRQADRPLLQKPKRQKEEEQPPARDNGQDEAGPESEQPTPRRSTRLRNGRQAAPETEPTPPKARPAKQATKRATKRTARPGEDHKGSGSNQAKQDGTAAPPAPKRRKAGRPVNPQRAK